MTSKRKFLVTVLVAITCIFLYFLDSSSIKEFEYKKDTEEATKNVLSLYLEDGMLGLIALSKECYENEKVSPHHCFLIDVSSSVWDRSVTAAMRLPTEEYFDDEKIIQRLFDHDKQKKFNNENISAYMDEATVIVKQRLVVEWDLQKHKLDAN
jgi:hypothetical protein